MVLAYVPGVSSPVGAATLKTYQGNLVHSINLLTDDNDNPGKDGGYEGDAVTIDVHTSQDWGGDILTYAFDCDNDGAYEIGPQAGATAQCTFYDSTTAHAVSVRLVDAQGGVGTDSTRSRSTMSRPCSRSPRATTQP